MSQGSEVRDQRSAPPAVAGGSVDFDTQQLVCASEPFCKCVGSVNEWDECDCFADIHRRCVGCGAEMKLIDFNTGEEIQ